MKEEVTSDAKVKPTLKPLFGEDLQENQANEARSDISVIGFWSR